MLFRRYKLILYDALFLLAKYFQYIRICLYSATLYFLITWYSYIFFREKTLLCVLFWGYTLRHTRNTKAFRVTTCCLGKRRWFRTLQDFLKTWFSEKIDERKFSCGYSFEATRLYVHATQIFLSYNVLFRRYKLILYDALFLLVKCFQYVCICLYSKTLYFLITWYSYIFFREKTILCVPFWGYTLRNTGNTKAFRVTTCCLWKTR